VIDHTTIKITDIKVEDLPIHRIGKPLNKTQKGLILGVLLILTIGVAYFVISKSKKNEQKAN
jgi:hypothetical protein